MDPDPTFQKKMDPDPTFEKKSGSGSDPRKQKPEPDLDPNKVLHIKINLLHFSFDMKVNIYNSYFRGILNLDVQTGPKSGSESATQVICLFHFFLSSLAHYHYGDS